MDEQDQTLDTSTETTTDTDTGGGEIETGVETSQPAQSSDWRVNKYGEDFENNLEYLRDTTKYLRGELDKAKKARPYRGIEHEGGDAPSTRTAQPENGTGKPGEFKDVDELIEFVRKDTRSNLDKELSEREKKSNFRSSIMAARNTFTAEDGFPSFQDLEEEVLIPLVKQNPRGNRSV